MGQYNIIVNITKEEYFQPDSGGKLRELSTSPQLQEALTLLLATGNGLGSTGEFCKNVGADASVQDKRRAARCNKKLAMWAGRWAGDKIAVTGDYSEDGYLIPKKWLAKAQGHWATHNRPDPVTPKANLYYLAIGEFRDLAPELGAALRTIDTPYFAQHYAERALRLRFITKVGSELQKLGVARKPADTDRSPQDLSWVSYDVLVSLFACCVDTVHLLAVKKWLRQQVLAPWQIELLPLFSRISEEGIVINREKAAKVLIRYGYFNFTSPPGTPVLPDEDIWHAALAVQEARNRHGKGNHIMPPADPVAKEIAEVAGIPIIKRRVEA